MAAPSTTLETFIRNVFQGEIIQDDDEIAQEFTRKYRSPDGHTNANGEQLDFEGFKSQLAAIRKDITNRVVISQTFITLPKDETEREGIVSHTTRASGIRNGKKVFISGSAILEVTWDSRNQRRIIVKETTMNRIQEA